MFFSPGSSISYKNRDNEDYNSIKSKFHIIRYLKKKTNRQQSSKNKSFEITRYYCKIYFQNLTICLLSVNYFFIIKLGLLLLNFK